MGGDSAFFLMGKSSSQCGVLEPVSAKVMGGRLGYKGGELERGVCVCTHVHPHILALGLTLGLFVLKLHFSQIWVGTKSNMHFCSNALCVVFDWVS